MEVEWSGAQSLTLSCTVGVKAASQQQQSWLLPHCITNVHKYITATRQRQPDSQSQLQPPAGAAAASTLSPLCSLSPLPHSSAADCAVAITASSISC